MYNSDTTDFDLSNHPLTSSNLDLHIFNVISNVGVINNINRKEYICDIPLVKAVQLALSRKNPDMGLDWEISDSLSKYTSNITEYNELESYIRQIYLDTNYLCFLGNDLSGELSAVNEIKHILLYHGNKLIVDDDCFSAFKFGLITKSGSHSSCLFINRTSDLQSHHVRGVDYIFCQVDDFLIPLPEEITNWEYKPHLKVVTTAALVSWHEKKLCC
ncbi:hypothetical protein QY211_04980 [Vibrio alginolyticus]|nr:MULTISPECIES: hypothetical protein [Vibrio]EIQ1513225.1 hypothetical protein [Vibrio parahaemolyticus]EIV8505639.1 hypothetical protein [Vibrio parahaemolyticus]EJT1886545.1 hypothetical protein [Vibrio parahaemolyticus]ELA9876874.1 hypothetical protein [Vibrio parahaemolyticus]MBS9892112.1 hypothetical protein [Vibrio alginolyticus]